MSPNFAVELSTWHAFIDSINVSLDSVVPPSEIADAISGQTVEWDGKVKAIKIGPNKGRAIISMPRREVHVGGLEHCVVASVVLPVRGVEDKWKAVGVGDNVKFRAEFLASGTAFPPFGVSVLDDDKRTADIRFSIGVPVE